MANPPALKGGYQLWHYYPQVAGNVIFAAIFAALSILHTYYIVRKNKKFCIPLVVGGLFEVLGYAIRAKCHSDTASVSLYAIQSTLILLAPILFAASTYMYLSRVIRGTHGETFSFIKPKNLTRIFVTGDVVSFLIQGGGGGILASAKSNTSKNLGNYLVLAGLIIQILLFLIFIAVAVVFHRKISTASHEPQVDRNWHVPMLSLHAVSFLIVARNMVRTVEYAMGSDGELMQHEWYIFVFDAMLMVFVLCISVLWYLPFSPASTFHKAHHQSTSSGSFPLNDQPSARYFSSD